jgi:hypothetical protein
VDAGSAPVDVALVHESAMAEPLVGRVPLLLSGHAHERGHVAGGGSLQLVQGSSGGAGLRSLDGEDPMPLEMSVLHFDGEGALLAVDDITVGGLGQRSVTVERRTAASYGDVDDELPDAGLQREPQGEAASPPVPAALVRSPPGGLARAAREERRAAGPRPSDVSVARGHERP